MECKATRKLLHRYLDKELTTAQAIDVHAHLGRCAECSSRFAELDRADGLMQALQRQEPTESAESVAAACLARAGERKPGLLSGWVEWLDWRVRIAGAVAGAFAAVALAATGSYMGLGLQRALTAVPAEEPSAEWLPVDAFDLVPQAEESPFSWFTEEQQ